MSIKKVIKDILNYTGLWSYINDLRHYKEQKIVYNVNKTVYPKQCLMIYIVRPFVEEDLPEVHQNLWQAKELARLIGTRGYNVDVCNFNNTKAVPRHKYDFVVGLIPRGRDIYSSHLNSDAKKIAYLTSMNLAVTTANEQKRLDDVEKRRGVRLIPRRGSNVIIENKIEEFDGAWYIGNEYNFHSYDSFKMPPSYRIVNSGYAFDWVAGNEEKDPKSFSFFASSGQVHKGLDLLLEIFTQRLPDYTLYVCSCYEEEEDFMNEYHKELFESPNIKAMGFIDINGPVFKEVSKKCAYTILPSCAEGCAGSVLTAMSAGMIPIVSKECGFEDDEVINLPDCSMDTICDYVKKYGNMDEDWIEKESMRAVEVVRNKYSKECFTKSVEAALDGVLNS